MQFVFAIALMVAGYFLQAILAPKPTAPKPAAFDDLDIPQMDEGTPQAVVFGDVWTEDWMVLWYGNFKTKAFYD